MTASPTERRFDARRVAELALLTALSLLAGYVEGLLPPVLPMIPVRLGLANVFSLFALLRRGRGDALAVALLRCPLLALVAGRVSQLFFSLAGGLLAWGAMAALLPLYRCGRVGAVGLSVAGAFCFNVGQLAVGCAAAGPSMAAYLPWMGLPSIPAGAATGLLAALLDARLPHPPPHGSGPSDAPV